MRKKLTELNWTQFLTFVLGLVMLYILPFPIGIVIWVLISPLYFYEYGESIKYSIISTGYLVLFYTLFYIFNLYIGVLVSFIMAFAISIFLMIKTHPKYFLED